MTDKVKLMLRSTRDGFAVVGAVILARAWLYGDFGLNNMSGLVVITMVAFASLFSAFRTRQYLKDNQDG